MEVTKGKGINGNSTIMPPKMTVEDLKNVLTKVTQQNMQLRKDNAAMLNQLQTYNRSEFYNIIEWNWKVFNSNNAYLNDKFKKECAERFMKMLTPVDKGTKEGIKEKTE